MKRLGALAVVTALALAAAPAWPRSPVRIGASLSLTGTYAKPGKYGHEGYQLCVKDLNASGGLLGRPVELVVYDDRSDPQTGVRLYEKLITEDNVDAVMGPYSSPITEAVANVTEKYRKVMVAPLASTTSIFKKGRKYVFMVVSPAEVYLEGLIDLAAERGLKTVAIINEDTLFTKTAAQAAAEAVPRQLRELDVNPRMFGVTVGGDLPEFYDLLKQNAEYVYGASQWELDLPYPGSVEFVEAYRRDFGREPVYHSTSVYAGCHIFAEAVRRAGTLDSDRVREELLGLEARTVFGGYKVDADGFQIGHKMVTSQWQGGRKVIVWPEDLATGKPRFPTPPWNQR